MIVKQSPLGLQKCRFRKDATDLINLSIDTLVGLEELLAAVYVKHECHDILRKTIGDLS